MKHMRQILLTVLATLTISVSLAGEVSIPNSFIAGTPAHASEVNANFDAIKAAVNDNNARINTMLSQAQTPAYKYKNVIGTLSIDKNIFDVVYYEFEMYVDDTTKAIIEPLKLIVVDNGPGIVNMAAAVASVTHFKSASLNLNGMTIDQSDLIVSSLGKMGKEFALPTPFVTSASDPELVSLTLRSASVAVTNSTGGVCDPMRYVQLGETASIDPNLVPAYRYTLSITTPTAANPKPTFAPVTVASPATTSPVACLANAVASGKVSNELTYEYVDNSGTVLSRQGLTLKAVTPIAYKLYLSDTGSSILSVDYSYDEIMLEDPSSTRMCWNVATGTAC